jgi:hypothetical protein
MEEVNRIGIKKQEQKKNKDSTTTPQQTAANLHGQKMSFLLPTALRFDLNSTFFYPLINCISKFDRQKT